MSDDSKQYLEAIGKILEHNGQEVDRLQEQIVRSLLIEAYLAGFERGMSEGESAKAYELRKALQLTSPAEEQWFGMSPTVDIAARDWANKTIASRLKGK